jgi:hypothetical protein
MTTKIGDKIKDWEDSDCYFIGEITKLNIFGGVEKYRVISVFWNGENITDDDLIGKEITPRWWYIEKL